MSRIKIGLPAIFHFSTAIPIRITDLNYGGHVGNDMILGLLHEARVQFLASLGYKEMDFAGVGLIMTDVAIEFRSEIFYGDTIIASVSPGDLTRISFDLYYKLEKQTPTSRILAAAAKTSMACYDYSRKKLAPMPEEAGEKFKGLRSLKV
jgi:acyl-CoA thioesterase FadM